MKKNNVNTNANIASLKEKKSSKFFASLKNIFKNLKALIGMQFRDQMDFSYMRSKKKILFKTVYSILIFVAITAIIYIGLNVVVMLGLFSFIKVLNYRAYLVLMTLVLALSFIACLVKITKTLYFSKDNVVLITMPVGNNMIFTSKLIVSFIYELIKNINWILPFFFAYGLVLGLPILYYLWSVLALVFFTLLCVIVCGLLSIPAMLIAILFKKHKVLEYLVVAIVISGATYVLVKGISLIPQDIDIVRDWGRIYWSIQDFLASFATNFVIFDLLLQMFSGTKFGSTEFAPFTATNTTTFLFCLLIMAVSLLLIYLLTRRLFLRMISSPFEYKKSTKIAKKANKKKSPFASAVVQQSIRTFRTPNLIYNVLIVALLTPIAVFLQNKIVGAMDTRLFGNNLGLTFNILIILLMTLASNSAIASVFSREGNSAYLNKVNPVPYYIPLSAKFILNAVVNIVSIIVSVVIISIYSSFTIINSILLALALILTYLAHLLWSADLDIMNPQNQQYQTTGDHNKNPNEIKSTIIAFLTTIVFTFAAFTFVQEDMVSFGPKLFLISAIYFGMRIYLYFSKVKYYYKEK